MKARQLAVAVLISLITWAVIVLAVWAIISLVLDYAHGFDAGLEAGLKISEQSAPQTPVFPEPNTHLTL